MTSRAEDTLLFVDLYEEAFIRRCHELLRIGHNRLTSAALANLDEPTITGMLCDAIEEALDAPDRPEWGTHFIAVDDQPESVNNKTGKRRSRTDICIRCTDSRTRGHPASRFRFESKRLGQNFTITEYLGENGMLALIKGHYGSHPFTGMVGYVQSESCAIWLDRIKNGILQDSKKYHATTPVKFPTLGGKPDSPVLSSHQHNGPKSITHTLLLCL